MKDISSSEWDRLIAILPNPHILQTHEWGQVKAAYGWRPFYQLWMPEGQKAPSAAALILQRTVPMRGLAARLRVLYIPKGPLMDWTDRPLRQRVLGDLKEFAQKQGAIFIKIDPDVPIGSGIPGEAGAGEDPTGQAFLQELKAGGWRFSPDQIQFRNSVWIDLTPTQEELLSRMKQKTRYNIRLAQKKGVVIRPGTQANFPMLYKMYAETSLRDGFTIRSEDYYQKVWGEFTGTSRGSSDPSATPWAVPLIAEVDGEPIAALFIFLLQKKAWYLYGMSRELQREKMPNYLLQWEAIRYAKNSGCTTYDLWGAPDEFTESDPMWGVYRFKEGLGGQVVRTIGAWDLPVQPFLYRLYTQTLPRLLDLMRRRGKAQTQQAAGL